MSQRFRITEVDWASHQQLSEIRKIVFIDEQNVPVALEWDGHDDSARHLLAQSADGTPIGVARLRYHAESGSIGRMAVLPAWRHQGVGSALLKTAIAIAQSAGLQQVRLSAQVHAMGFYRQHGFCAHGDTYMDAGIAHQEMRLTLP